MVLVHYPPFELWLCKITLQEYYFNTFINPHSKQNPFVVLLILKPESDMKKS